MSRKFYIFWFSLIFTLGLNVVSASELERGIVAAEQIDPTLAIARANRDAAQENIGIARARLLPQISAQGAYAKNDQDITQTNPVGQSSNRQQNVKSLNSSVSVRQGLLRPRDWLGLSIGELQSEFGFQKLVAAQSDLWLRVVSAWMDVLAANENYKAQLAAVDSTQRASEQARKRFIAGDGTKDVQSEANAQFIMSKAQLFEAEQTLKARQLSYQLLTGHELNLSRLKLPNYNLIKLPLTLEALTARALSSNGEILSLKLADEINKKRVQQAATDHLPTVDFVGSYTKADSDTINTIGTQYTTKSIGIQLVIPIFSGGGVSATERQQAATYQAALAETRAMETRIQNQLNLDWSSYLSGFDRTVASKKLVDAALDQRQSYQMGLKSGIKTWGDIAQAEVLLARRQQEYILSASNYLKTQARLLATIPSTDDDWMKWIKLVSSHSN